MKIEDFFSGVFSFRNVDMDHGFQQPLLEIRGWPRKALSAGILFSKNWRIVRPWNSVGQKRKKLFPACRR
jgi:hypothetical protein